MDANIKPRAPKARCYKCGSAEIAAICHHCGRPTCREHIGKFPRPVEWLLRGPLVRLRLSPHDGQPAMHCQRCLHSGQVGVVIGLLVIVFVGLAVLLALALNGYLREAVIGLVLSSALLAAMLLAPRRQVNFETMRWGKVTPVFPRVDMLRIVENYREVHALLDRDGRYRLFVEPAIGTLTGKFSLDPPRLTRWQRLVRRLRPRSTVTARFSAGFLVLQGQIAVKDATVDPPTLEPLPSAVIPLVGERSLSGSSRAVNDFPAGGWSISQTYRSLSRLDKRKFPVQLVPSLRPDAEQHTLELCFQFIQPGPPFSPIVPQQIDLLKLTVPATWGEVEYTTGGAQVSKGVSPETGEGIRLLTWERLSIGKRHVDQGWRVLQVRFAEEIKQAGQIEAFAKVAFSGVLSGITGASLFSPLGLASELADPIVIETVVQLDFVGQLNSLRYQRVRTVPSPSREEGATDYEPFLLFPGVAPTPEAIVKLTNRLSESDFYIQWIVENPPHTGERADVTNHYWDIGGRHYQGISPIDFHLVVTGHAVHSASAKGPAHETKVVLSVQGVYTIDAMAEEVDRVYRELIDLTKDALEPKPSPNDADNSSGETS